MNYVKKQIDTDFSADKLFLNIGQDYQIRDQEIEQDEIVTQRDDYRGEIPSYLLKTNKNR
jgi:hypothetical protein